MPSASVLLDLADAEETESLGKALAVLGLSSSPCIGEADLSETIRRSGADFVLVDGESWPALSASLPHPPRSYLIVVLLDPKDEGGAPKALAAGAFDYILRDGPGWEGHAACYFRALGALRRRLASAFGALERRYEDLVHALPDIVYELDAEGRITFINNSVRLLGYEPAELAGQHFSVLLHDDDALAVDREEVLGWFSGSKTGPALSPKLFNERRGLDRRTENLELRLKRKKGSAAAHASAGEDVIASIISYGEVTAVGEYARSHTEGEAKGGSGAEGAFVGSVGVIRDITLRRKSEDMLRKLYQAVDQLSAGVIVANRDMVVEYVNPAFLRMSDQSPQDLLGRHVFSLFDITEERAAEAASLVDSGFEVREELLLKVAKDPGLAHAAAPSGVAGATGGANSAGAGTWVAFHASPVRSPNGDVTHASIICEDISQQRAMEELLRLAKEEAERADRAKSDFLASMSHELKSPVASILAAARLVEMGSPEPERRARSIIGSAQGLLSLLGDILDFVRFETGGNTLRKFVFPLKGFIARTVEPYRAEAVAKGLAFDVGSLPDESVYSDPDRLGRALAALLDNAVSYTDRGTVRLETAIERRGGNVPYLLLTVSDTGIGIAPEDQGRIFAPFVQLQSPYNKKGGAGIGLSLARNIVRALGGEVRLQSEPGRGSVFTILVPMGEPGGIVEEKARDEAAPAGGRAYRLLVVDDNEVNLEYMAAILGNAGHKVDKASSGAEALKLAEERPPDAALLDIQMPGMSGIELERRMRAYAGSRYDAGLPIFALTAFDPQEVVDSGADFAGIFAKPFDAGLLLRAIDLAVDKGDSAGFGLVSGSNLSFERALKEVPPLFSKLSAGVESGDAESFRTAAQTLAGRLEALGAAGAVAAMRRLALAVIWEDRTVVDSRIRRFAAAWSAAADTRRPGRGDQGQ